MSETPQALRLRTPAGIPTVANLLGPNDSPEPQGQRKKLSLHWRQHKVPRLSVFQLLHQAMLGKTRPATHMGHPVWTKLLLLQSQAHPPTPYLLQPPPNPLLHHHTMGPRHNGLDHHPAPRNLHRPETHFPGTDVQLRQQCPESPLQPPKNGLLQGDLYDLP